MLGGSGCMVGGRGMMGFGTGRAMMGCPAGAGTGQRRRGVDRSTGRHKRQLCVHAQLCLQGSGAAAYLLAMHARCCNHFTSDAKLSVCALITSRRRCL
jgi:hypothetical protein